MSVNTDSSSDSQFRDLENAKKLIQALESGNRNQADNIIATLRESREVRIYQDLGKLTRDLHEAIIELCGDTRLKDIVSKEMPDTRSNLAYVVRITEEATHKTLAAIEDCVPVLDALAETAKKPGILPDPEYTELRDFIHKVYDDSRYVRKKMSDILMSQGFQDISGQIIQRVGKMVQDLETSLVSILRINSQFCQNNKQVNDNENRTGHGPRIPDQNSADTLNCQDDVDDFLSTLGF